MNPPKTRERNPQIGCSYPGRLSLAYPNRHKSNRHPIILILILFLLENGGEA